MKVSQKWLRTLVEPPLNIMELANKLTCSGLEVDSIDIQLITNDDVSLFPNFKNLSELKEITDTKDTKKATEIKDAIDTKEQKTSHRASNEKNEIKEILNLNEKDFAKCLAAPFEKILEHVSQMSGEKNSKIRSMDYVMTFKLPANRGDCLCMDGIAREIQAQNNIPYQKISFQEILPNISHTIPITIEKHEACPRYVGRIIQNINPQAKTPEWMKDRLLYAGIKLISPVVDILNYVMLEFGQPMHAFDLEKINKEIIVRFANTNESIETLDGSKVLLNQDTLIIADHSKPLAIAGIIGGLSSSVTEKSSQIFLESAFFDPIQIRKTSKELGLRTESSIRFEKGVDKNLQILAMNRATKLIIDITGGNVSPLIEKSDDRYLPQHIEIKLRNKRIQQVLGVSFKESDIIEILQSLEMEVVFKPNEAEGIFYIQVPSFRTDITREEDVIEEILRIYGYDKIKSQVPIAPISFISAKKSNFQNNEIKKILMARGYFEVINYSFVSKELLQHFDTIGIELLNPISADMSHMRTSLIPGLLNTVLYNQHQSVERFRFFEMGAVFLEENGKIIEKILNWR